MIGLDTNLLVRLFVLDDAKQVEGVRRLLDELEAAEDVAFVNHIVLCELMWVLRVRYTFSNKDLEKVVEQLLGAADVLVEDGPLVQNALDEFRLGKGDFADYLLGLKNRSAGCETTVTFDRGLRKSDLFRVL